MRRASEFSSVIRSGTRVRRGSLVVYHLSAGSHPATGVRPPVVGLIVGGAVGPSVVRHRVSRQLRAQLANRLVSLPPESGTVVRALPGAADADSSELGRDLDAALARLLPTGRLATARRSGGSA
jgi:ribonuclease P protein component